MTTKKSKEEKRMMFFDMQEHPDRYTDEQMEALLADGEMKAFFHDMALARMAQQKANPESVDVDEAWSVFAAKHRQAKGNRMKIAASIVGVVFLSGVALAAIHSGVFRSSSSEEAVQVKTEQSASRMNAIRQDSVKTMVAEKTDSLDLKPVVFDNAELGDVVSQLAMFYQVKVEFMNEASRHIRIFFNWDKTKTLQQNIGILNAFDRIQITEEGGTLKVE